MEKLTFNWSIGPAADLIRDIVEQATLSGLKDNTISLSLILKEHWKGIKRDAPMPYGWDRKIIEDFAAKFDLKPTFEDFGLFVVLRGA